MCNVKFTRFELGAFLDISATRSFIIALKKIQILHPEKPAGEPQTIQVPMGSQTASELTEFKNL